MGTTNLTMFLNVTLTCHPDRSYKSLEYLLFSCLTLDDRRDPTAGSLTTVASSCAGVGAGTGTRHSLTSQSSGGPAACEATGKTFSTRGLG